MKRPKLLGEREWICSELKKDANYKPYTQISLLLSIKIIKGVQCMGNINLPKFIIEYSQNGQHFKKAITATNRERACEIAFACAGKFTIDAVTAA